MSGLPLPEPEELNPAVAAQLRHLPPLNVLSMLGRTGWLDVVSATLQQMFDGTQFPAADREVMILRIAAHTGVDYPLPQHRIFARNIGLPDATIDAVILRDLGALDEWTVRLCLISEEITDKVVLSEASLDCLITHYGADGAAKAIWMMGWFNMLVRFVGSARLPIEESFASASGLTGPA